MARKIKRTPEENKHLILKVLDAAKKRIGADFRLVKAFESSEDIHKLELTVEFFDPDILNPVV